MTPVSTSTGKGSFRVAFLLGSDSPSTRAAIEAVCRIDGVTASAILLDTHHDSLRRRLTNLKRNLRRNGWRYIPNRILHAFRLFTDGLAERSVLPPGAAVQVLRKAFPQRCFTLDDIGTKYDVAVRRVGNLNSPAAARALEEAHADLGIVLGTRVLKPTTFSVPRLGSVNLHKGKVPEYRGMPPGFWELFDGAAAAGVTVHFVDNTLDTGDVVETGEVTIEPRETPDSLIEKLHEEGVRVLVRAVQTIQAGTARRTPQSHTSATPRTRPTLSEMAALKRRLPYWGQQTDAGIVLKNLLYLAIFHSGIYSLVRKNRKSSRAAIILYHRVNDFSRDPLTVDTATFAGQLLVIAKYYRPMTSCELVRRLRNKESIPATTVLIHFDDAYRDVHTEGMPILRALGIPAAAFISSGFVGTNRRFQHDIAKYPFHYENCSAADIRDWAGASFEIGAHTVNHVDLAECAPEVARHEIFASRGELEDIAGGPVPLFSFPFGTPRNITPQAVEMVREAGYDALFSAHGGFVDERTSVWDIPRFGVSSVHRPLWLLMEIEGCALTGLGAGLKRMMFGMPAGQPAS
jgi:peptidoglycan/xylan/chitin deacetylase (PgdA/CDA1 family)